MEIASEILVVKEYNINKIGEILHNIKGLDLLNNINNSKESYLIKLKTNRVILPFRELCNELFECSNIKRLSYSLAYAFYLCKFKKDIFSVFYTTHFDEKFLEYSIRTVRLLLSSSENLTSCLDIIDQYYCLYNIWVSKDDMIDLDENMDEIDDMIQTYYILIKMNSDSRVKPILIAKINRMMKNIVDNYMLFGIKMILMNYHKFAEVDEIKSEVWKMILNKESINIDHILVMLISQLRYCLIPKIVDPKKKLDLYLGIDVDELISRIRNKEIDVSHYLDSVKLFSSILNLKEYDNISNKEDLFKALTHMISIEH